MNKIISVCLILLSFWLFAEYGLGWYQALKAPLAIEYEGPCLWAAYNLSLGNNIYPAERLLTEPFIATIYTPVYFVLGLPFQKMFGWNLWSLRAISMASFIVTIYFLWRLFYRSASSKLAASIGIMSFASYVSIWSWSLKARVDMASLAFTAWALDSFHSNLNKERNSIKECLKDYLPSIVASTLAIYTKQPSIIIPACIVLFLLLKKRFNDAIAYGAGVSSLSLLLFIPIQMITQGGFSSQIQFASHFPFSVFDMFKHLGWIIADWPKLLFGLASIVILMVTKKNINEAILPAFLFIISGAVAAYTLGTMFPNANHAFLFFLFSSWLTALAFASSVWIAYLVLPACLLSTFITGAMLGHLQKTVASMPETVKILNELKPSLNNKLILVEDPTIAMELGAKPYFVDIATFFQVWSKGISNGNTDEVHVPEDFIGGSNAKKFAAIVLNKNDAAKNVIPFYFWPENVVREIEENYYRRAEIEANGETHILYLPK
ncbi:MAG: glycosyltransferase family 39 protein [Candidatus Melainabacteria bacterium]|nr:glycosyltransferase family 39 protein [Candidatus Melainabacteria bacterium]